MITENGNDVRTAPNPPAAELGELFGRVIPDHEEGASYEVVVTTTNGGRLTYQFEPFNDGTVRFFGISYSGKPQ